MCTDVSPAFCMRDITYSPGLASRLGADALVAERGQVVERREDRVGVGRFRRAVLLQPIAAIINSCCVLHAAGVYPKRVRRAHGAATG